MDKNTTAAPQPDIDQEAIAEHASAIAAVARRYFIDCLAADPRAGGELMVRFDMTTRIIFSKELSRTWHEIEHAARRTADEAVRRAFAEQAS